jgi:AraC family transcriptional regulator
MALNSGVAVTAETWKGWPLRVVQLAGNGRAEGLVSADDTVLVWSGGKSEVTLLQQAQRQRFTRHAGTIDLIPKGTVVDEVSWQGQASTCVAVTFESGNVERRLGRSAVLERKHLRLALPDALVVELVHQLQAQLRAGQPWGSLYVEALSLTLASYVYGRYGSRASPVELEESPAPLAWERLIAFVEDHLDQEVGVSDLASVMGYSPDRFARLFKRDFGVTPYQYVLDRRVERAKSLLRGRGHSIAEVAITCGFSTQAHLCSAFKARVGTTPGSFRKSIF